MTFIFGRPRVPNFADIIKIATFFIRTTFKDSNKIAIFILISIKQKLRISGKNADVGRTQGVCHGIYTFFGSFLGKI